MQSIKKNIPGLAVCLAIAVPSWLLGKLVPVIGGPVFSILIGMLIALFWTPGASCKPGIGFTSKKILQAAVVLLGFGLNLNVVLQTGKQSLPIIVCTITTSLLVAFALHKLLHIDGETGTLIGVGSSICGGSAIAATAPVIGADDEEIAQAISVIFLFNVIAALIFPTLGGVLGLSNEGFGLFAGTGSITIELLSRGCGKVVSVERDAQHFRFISQIIDTLKAPNCYLLRTDVFRYLDRCNEQFDFIFADPPYALKSLEILPDLVFRHNLLKPDGLFVLEHGKTNDFSAHPSFKEHRTYGSVNFSFFKAKETANE